MVICDIFEKSQGKEKYRRSERFRDQKTVITADMMASVSAAVDCRFKSLFPPMGPLLGHSAGFCASRWAC
jgi:hypothetical protein